MKQLFFFLFSFFSFFLFSQAPVIEGTYYPVKNTKIKQVYDIAGGMMVPSIGINQVWDYRFSNNQFLNVTDTFDFGFYHPSTTPYANLFPNATHATYVRTPFNNPSDSLYFYWEVTPAGLFNLGGYNIKNAFDSTIIHQNKEFFAPSLIKYQDSIRDTIRTTIFANKYPVNSVPVRVKIKQRKAKLMKYVGYGTLFIPNGNYNNVALVKEVSTNFDSIFVDFTNTGNYVFATNQISYFTNYQFLRNNTFGSAFLMYLSADINNTSITSAWYTLPVDFGSISGTVFANNAETSVVTDGEMYLYRENSNFSKNDILAKTKVKTNGTFQFDSIPYGEYRIAVRPNLSLFPNSKITYYGDTTNWIDAQSIITTTTTSSGHKIHLQYHPAPAGSSTITGTIGQDWAFNKGNGIMASNPVTGIGIVVKRHPNNVTARVLVTDSLGQYDIGNLEDGAYTVFVDIPGLHMTGTYNFTVANSAVVNSLDFTVGKDSIHPINLTVIGVNEITASKNTLNIKAYPNPFSEQFSLETEGESTAGDKLEVYNVIGQAVKVDYGREQKAGKTIYHVSLQESNLPTGVYVIKLIHQQKQANLRLIKQ